DDMGGGALPRPHARPCGLLQPRGPLRPGRRRAVPGFHRPHGLPPERPPVAADGHHHQTVAAGRRRDLRARPWPDLDLRGRAAQQPLCLRRRHGSRAHRPSGYGAVVTAAGGLAEASAWRESIRAMASRTYWAWATTPMPMVSPETRIS